MHTHCMHTLHAHTAHMHGTARTHAHCRANERADAFMHANTCVHMCARAAPALESFGSPQLSPVHACMKTGRLEDM